MTLPSIEFCLCPPSPPRLPSVSALLKETCNTAYHDNNEPLLFPPHQEQQKQQDFLLPPPPFLSRSRSLSTASSASSVSSSMPSPTSTHYSLSDDAAPTVAAITTESTASSPASSPSWEPTSNTGKRKRGRPPNAARHQRDNWTFVTPTVWDVKPMTQHPTTVLLWPEQQQDSRRASSTHTFTNTKMDTALSIPKKKRGRKPKVQLEGNSCFVWRDLAAKRRCHTTLKD